MIAMLLALLLVLAPRALAGDPSSDLDLIKVRQPTPAKEFSLSTPAGGRLTLSQFRGKVRLVNFWATWCPPCRQEMPSMERLYRRHKDHGFTILAVSIDTNTRAVPPFVKRFGLTFPVALDPSGVAANDYFVRSIPASFLIDRGGNIIALALGARDWDGTAADALLDTLLRSTIHG